MSDKEREEPGGSAPKVDQEESPTTVDGGTGAPGKAPGAEEAAKAAAGAKAAQAAEAAPWERPPQAPEWEDAGDDPLAVALAEELGEAIESARRFAGDLVLEVRREDVQEVCAALKEKHRFEYLVDVCGVDFPAREERFEVIYNVYSLGANRRVRVKVRTDEATEVPSVTAVWRGAEWCEREVYDMYGVRFASHPDMTRILLWEGFNGHPLRKDFPVEGIDTGCAVYPEYYPDGSGPVDGTGTGWKPPKPPSEES